MKVISVNSDKTKKAFHNLPRKIYADNSYYVNPLDIEIEAIFNPEHNKCFKSGDAQRWILQDKKGTTIGRIAAFYDEKKAMNNNLQPTGGIGFFECINDQQAANQLFDTAKEWLSANGMEAMDGPINFGENFVNWGLLIEGYMQQAYGMPYHKPYYKDLFDKYGFREYFKQHTYHVDLNKGFPARMVKFAEYIASKPEYTFEHFRFDNAEKYISDLVETYNIIWSSYLESYAPLQSADVRQMVDEAKPIIDEDLIWFAYHEGKPIAMVIVFPDVNQIIKPFKGKLNLINKIRFLIRKKRKLINRSRVLIAGVIPEFQKSGILGALFLQYVKALDKKPQHKEIELSWVGDYNEEMIRIYKHIGGQHTKTHATMRYLFDKNAPFERFTNESMKAKKNVKTAKE